MKAALYKGPHSIDEWIAKSAIPFEVDAPGSIDAAADRVMELLGDSVELLGLAEALHGSEEILLIRNRLFQRLAAAHGFSAVVIETSSPQARAVNEYVLGLREAGDPDVREWFGAGFGAYDANRELVEWMREHNRDHSPKLHFYGFDIPLAQGALASPGRVLDIVFELDDAHRERFSRLLGDLADWERPAAWYDPFQSIGLSERAAKLRLAVLDLISDLRIRRPELATRSGSLGFAEALHHAELARKVLDAHAALATPGAYARMLGIRDLVMADNLEHFVALERGRGKVLVFAAAGHLKHGQTEWHLPPEPDVKVWWAAGSHLGLSLGSRYRVIGMAPGVSEVNGVAEPEPRTVEAHLLKNGKAMFIPMPSAQLESAPVRTGSALNPTYYVLTPSSFDEFDALVFLPTTSYPRGAEPLSSWTN